MITVSRGLSLSKAPAASSAGDSGIESASRSTAHDRTAWLLGCMDAIERRRVRVTPADVLAGTFSGGRCVLSYFVGYRAGELQQRRPNCAAKPST